MANCDPCPYLPRIEVLELDSQRNQKTHKEFFEKFETVNIGYATTGITLDNILSTLGDLQTDMKEIKKIVSTTDSNAKDIIELKESVSELQKEPADSWRKFKWAVVVALVSAIMGLLIGRFGGV